jgi:hypothetical protein
VGGRELRWQLITTRLAIELILSGVHGFRLGEDLARDLLVVERLILVRACRELGPVKSER